MHNRPFSSSGVRDLDWVPRARCPDMAAPVPARGRKGPYHQGQGFRNVQDGGAEGANGGRPGRSCEGLLAEGGKRGNTKKGTSLACLRLMGTGLWS